MVEIKEKLELKLRYREEVENVVCEEITPDELERAVKLGEEMIKFSASNGGVGLSGPQIGINKKIIVWQYKDGMYQMGFNPQYYNNGKKIKTIEGCLSYPNENYYLQRRKYVRAIYYVPNKERTELVKLSRNLRGEESIIFQHETDHINGITISMIGEKLDERSFKI